MGAKRKQRPHTPLVLMIRAEDTFLSSPPAPSTPYSPPIFLPPSSSFAVPSPSPLPATAAAHSSLPTAAIVGGSIAGAVVALAITATVVSAVVGKVGLSCILAPFCRILTSLCGSSFTQPCIKFFSVCCDYLPCWNCRKDGSDKTGGGTPVCCNYLQCWNRRNDISNKTGDVTPGKADPEIDFCAIDVLAGRSPEAVVKAETAAATAYALAKSPLRDVVKAHGDQLATSAQSFLTTQVSEFAEAELQKKKAFIMQPLCQTAMKTQGYFESLHTATSNASDELKVLKSSANTYLEEISKLKASAEHMSKQDVALMLEEATIGVGAEKIKNSTIAREYAAGMKRLQKLQNEPFILDEEVLLNRLLAKDSLSGGEADYHHEGASKGQNMQYRSDAGVQRGHSVPNVETLSDESELQVEELGAIAPNHSSAGQQYMSSVVLVPTTAANAGVEDAIQPTAGPIVPVPTKAITVVPPQKMASAAAKKTRWRPLTQQDKRGNRPTNLGHVSFSCEISAHRLHFFTSCRSGGIYGSPPATPAHAGDDLKRYYNNNNYVELHELDLDSNGNNGKDSNYYNNSFASHPNSYGGNNHVGLLTRSRAPIRHHYNVDVQHQQLITNSGSSHQMHPANNSTDGSNSNALLDYGNPFEGVL